MQDQPAPADVLDLVVTHLRDRVLPKLDPRDQFELRVSIAALQLVQRSLQRETASDAAERERLAVLLGYNGELLAQNQRLADRIRTGELNLATVADHLRATTLEKLAIDQPSYVAYQRAMQSSEG